MCIFKKNSDFRRICLKYFINKLFFQVLFTSILCIIFLWITGRIFDVKEQIIMIPLDFDLCHFFYQLMHNIEPQPTQISNHSQSFKIKSLPTIIVFKLHYSTSCNYLSIYLFWLLTIKCGSCTKLKIYSTKSHKSNWQFGYFSFYIIIQLLD